MRRRTGGPAVRDALSLSFGTLTALRVRPPRRVDRRTAGWAMALAPLVGLVLGAAVVGGWGLLGTGTPPLLKAALALALLALLTRGIHLDGLADTADGVGSARPPAEALAVMRRGDVGPFGVVTLGLTLLVQAAALEHLLSIGTGSVVLPAALVLSRLVLPVACARGVPAARREGLGALVAGSVTPVLGAAAVLVSVAGLLLVTGLAGAAGPGPLLAWTGSGLAADSGRVLQVLAIVTAPLVVGAGVCWWAVRRLGGVTGDVLGACVELAFTACLVVACL